MVRRCFALRFRLSRVRFPRSRSARAPCTGNNHPFTGSLCLKGKIVTKFQAPARARLERAPRGFDPAWEMLVPAAREPGVERQRGGRTANQDRRSMCIELPWKCLAPRCSVCRAFYCSACSEPHTSQQRVMEPTHDTHRALRPHTQSPRTATAVSAQASSSPASAKAISALTAQT